MVFASIYVGLSSIGEIMANRTRVLVVDDEISILHSIKQLLEEKGLFVSLASNGSEALAKLENDSYDIVITDYYMPVMNGKELLNLVKERYPNILVIVSPIPVPSISERSAASL